ncbi:hypothetical protein PR048_012594 [Dryococelus australis]|uniref:HAT C-terminal dimerisation domain-containing protein n=1 Tax=Dryococelus australis TaxID=614101 RepID=A0ABQ9HPU0_9NEOP|nr:hypothetical protein PR048_012594 [Dryococelus australis]
MGRLTDLRTEEKFTELWEFVKKLGEDLDLEPFSLPCVRKSPKCLEHNINASPPVRYSSPEQLLRQKQLKMKSSNGEVENIRDQVLQIYEHFKGDLNVERFTRQLAMLTEHTMGRKINSVDDVLDSIRREQPQPRRLFSEVCNCLKLLLVLPATSATAKRTFSALRCLKTWLCSAMTQDRLNHIAILAVHRDLA